MKRTQTKCFPNIYSHVMYFFLITHLSCNRLNGLHIISCLVGTRQWLLKKLQTRTSTSIGNCPKYLMGYRCYSCRFGCHDGCFLFFMTLHATESQQKRETIRTNSNLSFIKKVKKLNGENGMTAS